MARVIAGSYRTRHLALPEGMHTRPTTDRNKEALFGVIQFRLSSVTFLDLFAGSGQIGIEALSRGACWAGFVETSPQALSCIRKNLSALALADRSCVYPVSCERALERFHQDKRTFGIIFMDPPYHQGWEQKAGQLVSDYGLLEENGLLIIESSSDTEVEIKGLAKTKEKTYKTTRFSFFEYPG